MTAQQLCFVVILGAAFGLLLTERLRTDLVGVLIIATLYCSGVLSASRALSGFSSEPAVTVAAVFVIGAAIHQTGVSQILGTYVGKLAGNSISRALCVIMPAVALMSAFTHHVTTTAVMLPVTLNLARERQMPASKLLM
ncbi:MAG: SLC13 family permease, partial [Deltaproteobacteria bacterium]